MKRSIVHTARKKTGMPCNASGKQKKHFTNQSETINNKLTRQKQAMEKKDKGKNKISKLEFVRDLWIKIDEHQQTVS